MALRNFRILAACLTMLLPLITPQTGRAQALYGSIIGTVRDSTDAVVAGATVTIINTETKQSRQATTNDAGGYDFPTIPPGTYDVKVSKGGFSNFTETGILAVANNTTRVDVRLNVGAVSESVMVTSAASALQTDRSEVRNEVGRNQLANLPVPLGRNYQNLFMQLPGFSAPQASYNSTPSNPSKALVFNVNGASFSINNTKIDGAQSINVWLPHETAYVPTLESVEAVNVVTNSFDAETGLAGGAAIFVQTKSGTNDIHGSLFENHTDQHLKAKNFFNPPGREKPKLVFNEFGAAVGGPIKKEKLFYFGSFEGDYDRENASLFVTVPTAAIKSGNMSGSPNPIYDPRTGDASGANRTPFPNNIIPADRISPISKKLADLTPLPNLPGNLLTNNYYASGSFVFDRYRADTKVNWNPTQKLTMFGRFGFLHYNMLNPQALGEVGGTNISSAGGNPGHGYGNTYSLTVAGTYLFTPRLILDAYYGYTRLSTNIDTPGLDKPLGQQLGIPGTNGPRKYEGGWPDFNVDSYAELGTPGAFLPYYRHDPSTQYVANFNWIRGSHDIRFGIELSKLSMNHIQAEGGVGAGQGGFTFSGGPTSILGGPSPNQFNSYATFLLGLPTSMGKNTIVPDEITTRSWADSLYIRDRWVVTPKLTVSYGTRWEYYPLPTRADIGLGLYDPSNNTVRVCGYKSVPDGCGVHMSKLLFAPRVGFAYRASNSFVIRAGYGITYDPYSLSRPLRVNYPTVILRTFLAPNSFQPAGGLAEGIPPVVLPDLADGIIPVPATYTLTTINLKEFKRAYIQSWNFTLQKELRYGFVAQAGYVATRSVDQYSYLNLNAGQVPGLGNAGRPLFQKFGKSADVLFYTPIGTDQYNALQARLERRFSAGLQFSASYTWSKSVGPVDNNDNTILVSALQYFNLNRAVRSYDRTQNLQLQGIWELPFGKGKPWLTQGVASKILGGWRLSSLAAFMTGLPFSVTASGTSLNMPGNTQRADLIKPSVQILGGVGSGASYFDPLAFAPVTQARFGTAGYYLLRGPGVASGDLGLNRDFSFTERIKLQFRGEAFNFTNTPHFGLPGTNVSNMVLNSDGSIRNLAGYSQILSTQNLGRDFDERQIRFSLRLAF